jgi:hypothetical protein
VKSKPWSKAAASVLAGGEPVRGVAASRLRTAS